MKPKTVATPPLKTTRDSHPIIQVTDSETQHGNNSFNLKKTIASAVAAIIVAFIQLLNSIFRLVFGILTSLA